MISGNTTVGENNIIHPYVCLGGAPQDLKYKDEPTKLTIGDRNVFRESFTANTGTVQGGGETKIGNDCLFMSCSHVAHDCEIHDHVIMANGVLLAGHVILEDWVILSGLVGVGQSVRLGAHAFIGGQSSIERSVAPYCIGLGNRVVIRGVNIVGLKRRGVGGDQLKNIIEAHKIFFDKDREKNQALAELDEMFTGNELVQYFINFIRNCKNGLHR